MKVVDIEKWSICGGGRLERFYCVCIYIYMCICVYIYIYIYTHRCIHKESRSVIKDTKRNSMAWIKPDLVAKPAERRLSAGTEFKSWSNQTKNLQNWYMTLPSLAPAIKWNTEKTDQLSTKLTWLSGISGHDAGGLVSLWGKHYKGDKSSLWVRTDTNQYPC